VGIEDIHHLLSIKGIAEFDEARHCKGFDFPFLTIKKTPFLIG